MSGLGELTESPMARLRRRLLWEVEALERELGRMEAGTAPPPDATWAVPLYRRLIASRRRWLHYTSAAPEACAGAYGP